MYLLTLSREKLTPLAITLWKDLELTLLNSLPPNQLARGMLALPVRVGEHHLSLIAAFLLRAGPPGRPMSLQDVGMMFQAVE